MLRIGPVNAGGSPWELYSWHPAAGWHFSLLPGTDRDKTIRETTNPQVALAGVEKLKTVLRGLPPGTEVIWVNHATEPVPGTITEDLLRFSEREGLSLRVTWQ
jgi:hypothetical protein